MIRRPPRSTQSRASAASDVYKRQAVLAVGDTAAFQRRFGALVAELEAEIVGALYPGKVGSSPAHCRFDRNLVSRVSATFERVRGHVLNCTSDLPRWFRALTQERKEKRKRRREKGLA